jgi:hypothetical protein
MSSGFLLGPSFTTWLKHSLNSVGNNNIDNGYPPRAVDRQSDAKYGRGISHISADLSEGDIIAYQYGTWYVDGTEVGDGSPQIVRFMKVDTIQLVWTHSCEHGVINGFDINCSAIGVIEIGNIFVVTNEYVQIGPEQVLARIPAVLMKENNAENEMWLSEALFNPQDEIMTTTTA